MTYPPIACAILASAGLTLAAPAHATSSNDIQTRMVAQEGMAIGLASNVLQSQIDILFGALDYPTDKGCNKLVDAGSVQVLSVTSLSKTSESSEVVVYYDKACQTPYIDAQSTLLVGGTHKAPSVAITQAATYTGPTGQNLGSLSLSETATFGHPDMIVIGTGKFTPAGGAQVVDLGLTCTMPSTTKTVTKAVCQGGIAQDFPAIHLALASVTPLNLKETEMGKRTAVTFRGNNPNRQTGALGSLSITEASATTLGIAGSGTDDGAAKTTGAAADFVLFPPTPTHWDILDTAHHVEFTLNVVSNSTRNSTATVTDTKSAATLATIAVDESGTGTIAYASGAGAAITNWLLAD